jgi:hypothetical protein
MAIRYVKIYKRRRDNTLNANVVKHPRRTGKSIKVVKVDI